MSARKSLDEETKKGIRRMTEDLTNQSTIELLTRAGMSAKYKRWALQERKKAQEAAMASSATAAAADDEDEGKEEEEEEEEDSDTEWSFNRGNVTTADEDGDEDEDDSDTEFSFNRGNVTTAAKGKGKGKGKDAAAGVTRSINAVAVAKERVDGKKNKADDDRVETVGNKKKKKKKKKNMGNKHDDKQSDKHAVRGGDNKA
ncbi:hypothetical protein ACHAPT_009917 [Fusarium lateritium]